MTSQKRFRHQENSNTSARSRDLPPRFKRQKSSSGQTPPDSRATSPLSPQLEKSHLTDNMTKRSQIPASSGTTMNKRSTSQTPQSSNVVSHSVLRPVNYTYSDIPNASMPQPVLQPMPSHQMWTTAGYSGLQPVMMSPASVMVHPPVSQIAPLGDSMPYVNENCAPSPSFGMPQYSPMSFWNTSGYNSPYQSSCSSPVPSPVPSNVDQEQGKSSQPVTERAKSAGSPSAQYEDPDLRTIEMLRELERVADKESQEAEEGGSDRKTLVSHHLRMLMCAMDRYTENIDSDVGSSSRNDDGISTNGSNASSPSPSPVPAPRKALPQDSSIKNKNVEFQPRFCNQEPPMARPRPVLGMACVPPPMYQRPQPSSSLLSYGQVPQTPSVYGNLTGPHMSEWNMWSGQSFDFGGVIGHPLGLDGSNEHFETFQDACFPATKERKPLYKR